MHNIPVRELITSANSQEAMSRDLPYLRSLYRKLKGGSNITIFAGDSGALNHHPRSQCIDYLGLKIILNGIGGYDNDSIIVLNNEKLHSYIL